MLDALVKKFMHWYSQGGKGIFFLAGISAPDDGHHVYMYIPQKRISVVPCVIN
jgi:hypothetical protein